MIDKKFATHNREPFFDIVTPFIKTSSKVLDIGPGSANFSDFHQRNDFYLFEGNPISAERLKSKHPNTVYGQLPMLPFENELFDVIHCSHVVEHLEPQVFYDSIKEMDRCLSVGGTLVISAPMMWEGFYNDLSHVRPYNPSIYQRYLCGTDSMSLTRPAISENYSITKVQYRYKRERLLNFENSERNFVVGTFMIVMKLLDKLGMRRYSKTGYTIILQKGARSLIKK